MRHHHHRGAFAGEPVPLLQLAADPADILRVLFTRTTDNFSPQIEIFDPSGARIAANSDVTQKVPAGGNYLVLVSPSTSSTETGSYTIAYQRPNNPCSPRSLTCGQTNLRQVTIPGQLDTFTFTGTGGDVTTIRLTTRSGSYSPFVEMYNAIGTRHHDQCERLAAQLSCPPTGCTHYWCVTAARSTGELPHQSTRTRPTRARSTTRRRR